MSTLDETDVRILELLVENGRRSYSDIAEIVDLSPPAVSDRIDRLQESGVIRRFTVDIDRSQLRAGVPVLVTLELPADAVDEIRDDVVAADPVEHVFVTAEGDVVFHARVRADAVREQLGRLVDFSRVDDYDVTVVGDVEWSPAVGGAEFALSCAECGNTVTSEGRSERIGGERYHFCCPSCLATFRERYEQFEAEAT
ncbi:winged helix-turn-helix transcriptional regulator [Halobellus litoreus]|uniref:Winged helix-turn-helix transcriptional regulator n=1 Tax=Halobellus litoreus TaxID=755310 RepID=A0ABD6DSS7_9EURY|nr:winged helix-turn-helix transcriptional regulator [Halobellus litoreus]